MEGLYFNQIIATLEEQLCQDEVEEDAAGVELEEEDKEQQEDAVQDFAGVNVERVQCTRSTLTHVHVHVHGQN